MPAAAPVSVLVRLRGLSSSPDPLAGTPGVIALTSVQPAPADLPASGDPGRWPWLQQLRRQPPFDLEPWLQAIESAGLAPRRDLLAVLAERLDAPAQRRLLRWWRRQPDPDPSLPAVVACHRDGATAAWLQAQLAPGPAALQAGLPAEVAAALLPLLGHQRQPQAWPLLEAWLRAPVATPLRRAALEGVARGLPAWPRPALVERLIGLAGDLDPGLAATAVDLLARLPACRRWLLPLSRQPLEAALGERLRRRLAATAVQPLLLVVHGRSGGVLPAELQALALELERRRGAPVRLQALTAEAPPAAAELLRPGLGLTLVPLLLLPGGHVRHDLPAIVGHWRRHTSVRRLPFLGAWPRWQQALRRELAALGPGALVLHHPLEGALALRFLAHLERVCGGRCLATPYSAEHLDALQLTLSAPALPLALAANRFTDRLGDLVGAPLLQRPGLRRQLLDALEALP